MRTQLNESDLTPILFECGICGRRWRQLLELIDCWLLHWRE